ncbi:MAG TPA: hypothetical protein VN450_08390 [Candidatus Methylomirabilis sp.]|nr:hypothetical protein [Candidatus Methylomirabilis sp.]
MTRVKETDRGGDFPRGPDERILFPWQTQAHSSNRNPTMPDTRRKEPVGKGQKEGGGKQISDKGKYFPVYRKETASSVLRKSNLQANPTHYKLPLHGTKIALNFSIL